MATAITLAITDPAGASSWRLLVAEDFDTVFQQVAPLAAPTSTLEHRANMVYTTTDGRRLAIQPHLIAHIEEDAEE